MKKIILTIFILVLITRLSYSQSGKMITTVDAAGRKITVSDSANLIFLICEGEVMRLLDAEEKVVGINRYIKELYSEECPEMSKKPTVGNFSPGEVNYEQILKIAEETEGEDIVITYNENWAENVEERLNGIQGIKVVKFNFHQLDSFDSQLRILAKIIGKEERCNQFLEWKDSIHRSITDKLKAVRPDKRIKVYWDTSSNGNYDTANKTKGAHKIIELAGGNNIAKDLPIPSSRVSPEWILTENPEIIISHGSNLRHMVGIGLGYDANITDNSKLEKAKKILIELPGFKDTEAVSNGKVYFIHDNLMFGPQQAIGAMYLAKWFYPELFKELKPEEKNREFYERFMNLEYKGIYVYPEN